MVNSLFDFKRSAKFEFTLLTLVVFKQFHNLQWSLQKEHKVCKIEEVFLSTRCKNIKSKSN